MKKLISAILGVLAFGVIQADDHGSGWLVDIGEGVSQSSHLCTLKGKATLADVDKIDVKLHVDFLRAQTVPNPTPQRNP